jgi:O-acetylserine/cysteine efflux transporter
MRLRSKWYCTTTVRRIPTLKTHLAPRDLALALCVVAALGFAFVPVKLALATVPPFALAALRFLLAAIPLVFFIRRPAVSWVTLAAYGFAIGVVQFGLLFLGIKLGMPAGLSSLVIQVQVFFTIGLGAWLLHDPVSPRSLVSAGIAATGLALLGYSKIAAGATGTLLGFALVIIAALGWAVGNIIAKRVAAQGNVDLFAVVVWSSLAAPLPLFVASYFTEGGPAIFSIVAHIDWLTWGYIAFMSYIATVFGFACWNALLHRYPTGVIAPFALLIPVFGIASAALFLDESLTMLQYAGAALVLAGLAWNVYGARISSWVARTS